MPEALADNLLLILLSHQRPDVLGHEQRGGISTPGADRLAEEGTRFTRAFTPVTLGSPARASLFTGLLPHRHRVLENCPQRGDLPIWLEESLLALPIGLSAAGISTGYVGDWPLRETARGPAKGFSDWVWTLTKQSEYAREIRDKRVPTGNLPGGAPPFFAVSRTPTEFTKPAYLVRRAAEILERHAAAGTRFALTVALPGPRYPHEVPEPYASMFKPADVPLPVSRGDDPAGRLSWHRRTSVPAETDEVPWEHGRMLGEDALRRTIAAYLGNVLLIDHCVADLLGHLDEFRLSERTLVVYASDLGEFLGSHGLFGTGPFAYDEVLRVPLLVRQPGYVAPGVVRGEFASLLDLAPTTFEWLGLPVPPGLDGRSLSPMLMNDPAPADWPDAAYGQYHRLAGKPYPLRWIRTSTHAYAFSPDGGEELYDLAKDPEERKNLAADPAARPARESLRKRLFARLHATGDPLESAGP
ncbi:MAG: sulfatase-like hydrolase/transferase [Planctomycetota bacterium]